ncbi:class B sortase [Eggerthellaceae bacterium 3-80]|nr:SrtB family sortase [bacterium D16-34]
MADQSQQNYSAYQPVTPGYGRRPEIPKKKKGGVWRVIFWLALIVLIGALVALGAIIWSYMQGQKTYDEIALTADVQVQEVTFEQMTVDWDALLAVNPDLVGWIYIPGTVINYPIVQGNDDQYYLYHDFKGSEGYIATFGCIFLSAENDATFADENNVIYGHHLNDGSMFAAIADFGSTDMFNEHRTVYVLTPEGNYELKTMSIVHCGADDPLAQARFESPEAYHEYLQDKYDRSVVVPSGVAPIDDITKSFVFATCDNLASDGRWALFAYVTKSTVPGVVGTDDVDAAGESGQEGTDATAPVTSADANSTDQTSDEGSEGADAEEQGIEAGIENADDAAAIADGARDAVS